MPLLDTHDVFPVVQVDHGRENLVVYRPTLSFLTFCVNQQIGAARQTSDGGHLNMSLSNLNHWVTYGFWDMLILKTPQIKPDVTSSRKDCDPKNEPERKHTATA